jgi:hypothetical protein
MAGLGAQATTIAASDRGLRASIIDAKVSIAIVYPSTNRVNASVSGLQENVAMQSLPATRRLRNFPY